MRISTRKRIIDAAKPLFNQEGYGAPSLYQLAQKMGMSRGNLTYYFKDKESLLKTIIEEMCHEYDRLMDSTTQFPSWESTHESTLAFHELQRAYGFIFFDKQLLQLPEVSVQIKKMRRRHLEWQMSIIRFSIQIGNMKKEEIPGTYINLCRTIWQASFFWLMGDVYMEGDENDYGKYVWSIILPHFTEKGVGAFKDHFGEEYFDSLGVELESVQAAFLPFQL